MMKRWEGGPARALSSAAAISGLSDAPLSDLPTTTGERGSTSILKNGCSREREVTQSGERRDAYQKNGTR